MNQTPTECLNCINSTVFWYRNFSSSEQGTWYYRYGIGGTYTQDVLSLNVVKDNTTVEYVAGNNTLATFNSTPVRLAIRVFDTESQTYNLTPSATVNFRINRTGVYTPDKFAGTNTTNATGYAEIWFTPDCSYGNGFHNWYAEINSSEPNYNANQTAYFTITLDVAGCAPSIYISSIYTPKDVLLYRNFTINATITALSGNIDEANTTIFVPAGWQVDNPTQDLGTIAQNELRRVWWRVNATTNGTTSVTIIANGTYGTQTNDTKISSQFTVYDLKAVASPVENLPSKLSAGTNQTFSWSCNAGNYYLSNLTISSTNLTTQPSNISLRAYVYNGTNWIDFLHSYSINLTGSRTDFIPILKNQLAANESGYCLVKLANIGNNDINITGIILQSYYNRTIQIQDIQPTVNNIITTGLETSEQFFNTTIRIADSSTSESGTLWLNITNSSGYLVNYSSMPVSITTGSVYLANFTNINTNSWLPDIYNLRAYLSYSSVSAERSEQLIFKTTSLTSKSSNYMCNQTTEQYNVTVVDPFTDSIQYNVSLQNATGWTYSPSYQLINATSAGNYTVTFNLSSSSAASEIVIINATVNYTYPNNLQKALQSSYTIQEGNNLPILEIIRETPQLVGTNAVFNSQLTVYNKGCAATSGTTAVQELVMSGWTPANPSIKTNSYGSDVQLLSSSVDLINNLLTWQLGTIVVDKYAVLTYQIKSSPGISQTGTLQYNATWGSQNLTESQPFAVQNFNYTAEPHLEFDIETIQQPDYPWTEPRSIQPNRDYNYSLKVTNVGDTSATNDWNVTLLIPSTCSVDHVYNSGTWDATSKTITWQLSSLGVYQSAYLNYTANCTSLGKQVLTAQGFRDTRNQTAFSNDTNIGCIGSSCNSVQSYNFTKPVNPRYEKLSAINFLIDYDFEGQNVTNGQGYVNFTDDSSNYKIAWQNYTLDSAIGKTWNNYSIDSNLQNNFVQAVRNIGVNSYVDSTYNSQGNVTIEKLAYVWNTGKLFQEPEQLFTDVKIYTYVPLLTNASLSISGNSSSKIGGWGEQYNFSVMSMDRFGRDVTIYSWDRKGTGANYSIGSWTCTSCLQWTQANFTYHYNGTDIGSWDFKFNATNADGSSELQGFG
jgi:hypothetical protein